MNNTTRKLRIVSAVVAMTSIAAFAIPGVSSATKISMSHTLAPFSIKISGSHFTNGAGKTLRLVGVGGLGTESACVNGTGYSSTPLDASTVSAIKSWHANVVRISLNEDCWLGINAQPSYGTMAGYRSAIASFVSQLTSAGLYTVLALDWSAPGSRVATGQMSMPDDHSVALWASVASTFKTNHAVLFDVFSKPYSPDQIWPGSPGVPWLCWARGGCQVPALNDSQPWVFPTPMYVSVGVQLLINTVRKAGATQPVMVAGLNYGNDLSGFSSFAPTDSLVPAQVAVSFHNSAGDACANVGCWNNVIAPLATHLPVVTSEFGEGTVCSATSSLPSALAAFDTTYMSWADTHHVSYLATGWVVNGTPPSCDNISSLSRVANSGYGLITSLTGTPTAPDGQDLKNHLSWLHSTNPLL